MFFCLDLVFATSNTRVIKENDEQEVIVSLKTNEFVISNAVLHPITKINIPTYIVKENVPITISIRNHDTDSGNVLLKNYYFRNFKNKNIIIRCFDSLYVGGTEIGIIPNNAYGVLKATNKLDGCLFMFDVIYKVKEGDKEKEKIVQVPFKIVSEKEYDMYNEMEKKIEVDKENGVIKKPKKS